MSHMSDPFLAALQKFAPDVTGVVARILRDSDAAQDIWQETQLKALSRRDQLRDEGSLKPWVYRIAIRLAFDALRKRTPTGGDTGELDAVPAATTRSPTQQAVRTTNRRTLRELIDELPPHQKTLIVLRIDKKLSWKEVAAALETTASGEPMTADNARKIFERLIEDLRQAFRAQSMLAGPDDDVR